VKAIKAADLDAVVDRIVVIAQVDQLAVRDHAMLAPREPPNPRSRRLLCTYSAYRPSKCTVI
jgi:hypothetical protein